MQKPIKTMGIFCGQDIMDGVPSAGVPNAAATAGVSSNSIEARGGPKYDAVNRQQCQLASKFGVDRLRMVD